MDNSWADNLWTNDSDFWINDGWGNDSDFWINDGWGNDSDFWINDGWGNDTGRWINDGWGNSGFWSNNSWEDDSWDDSSSYGNVNSSSNYVLDDKPFFEHQGSNCLLYLFIPIVAIIGIIWNFSHRNILRGSLWLIHFLYIWGSIICVLVVQY